MEANLSQDLAPRGDRDLLRAFTDRADGAAFAELVARHGPLVLGACRRVLADVPDAEDAFQATFLILARKAGTVRRPERLAAWLYGVALRCAFRARKAARRAKEQPMSELPAPPAPDPEWADVRRVLDAEIGRLPEKLRTALVLCELQGMDRAAAADRLGVPIGTVSSRLSRAKEALRRRLVRRGISLSVAALGLALTRVAAAADVPPPLAANTVAGALRFKAGGAVTTAPAALATGVLRAQFLTAVGAAALILLIVLWTGGIAVWAGRDYLWPPPKTDWVKIQGRWTLVSFTFMGRPMAGAAGQPARINAGRIVDLDMGYTIDPSQSPKAIDVLLPAGMGPGGELCRGVYELTDDRLTIALPEPGRPRPAALDDPGVVAVIVFERVKE